jgi:hypothetical protein
VTRLRDPAHRASRPDLGSDPALRYDHYSMSDPQYAFRYAMPALAFVMQVAKVAVELTITTAFVILVAR